MVPSQTLLLPYDNLDFSNLGGFELDEDPYPTGISLAAYSRIIPHLDDSPDFCPSASIPNEQTSFQTNNELQQPILRLLLV